MTALELIIVATFAGAFAFTAAAQFYRGPLPLLKSLDRFSLVPQWSFFAPRPGMFDTHLLFRVQYSGGQMSPWQELSAGAGSHPPTRWLFNPQKRLSKSVTDAIQELLLLHATRPGAVRLTVPYIALLQLCSQAAPLLATRVQFAVLRSHPSIVDPLTFEPVLSSELHSLGDD